MKGLRSIKGSKFSLACMKTPLVYSRHAQHTAHGPNVTRKSFKTTRCENICFKAGVSNTRPAKCIGAARELLKN
jgi:hypothetical protein